MAKIEIANSLEKIVVIKRNSPLETLLKRHVTVSQVKFYLESRGESFDFYHSAHKDYEEGLQKTLAVLPKKFPIQVVEKEYLPTFHFSEKDLVIVVGDPGLVVNTAKYIGTQPLIAVNPDSQRFEDVLSTCTVANFAEVLQQTLAGKVKYEQLTLAQAQLEDGQTLYALNDFFIGRKTHVSARYSIEHEGNSERQSSSGIIVSTGTGSTGWYTSVRVGAGALISGDTQNPAKNHNAFSFPRDAEYLRFIVREPFPSKMTGVSLVHGTITAEEPLKIISSMPEEGVIFSDGVETDYLEFTAGKKVLITPAEQKINLVRAYAHKEGKP